MRMLWKWPKLPQNPLNPFGLRWRIVARASATAFHPWNIRWPQSHASISIFFLQKVFAFFFLYSRLDMSLTAEQRIEIISLSDCDGASHRSVSEQCKKSHLHKNVLRTFAGRLSKKRKETGSAFGKKWSCPPILSVKTRAKVLKKLKAVQEKQYIRKMVTLVLFIQRCIYFSEQKRFMLTNFKFYKNCTIMAVTDV